MGDAQQCNATFAGNPDIDGDGVLASFLVMAALTMAAALTSAYSPDRELLTCLRRWARGEEHDLSSASKTWWHRFVDAIQQPLCDVQLVTGLGITIAGTAQLSENISVYHLNLIYNYWNLSFISLWAAQSAGFDTGAGSGLKEHESVHVVDPWVKAKDIVRSLAICVSVALGAIVGAQSITRGQPPFWNPGSSGDCYIYGDDSWIQSGWLWIAGLWLYLASVLMGLFPKGKRALDFSDQWLVDCERWMIRSAWRSLHQAIVQRNNFTHRFNLVAGALASLYGTAFAVLWMLAMVWWFLRQFFATWAVGAGTPAATTLMYLGFFALGMENVISSKALNHALVVVSDDSTWGFGQILQLVLLLAVLFNALDAARKAEEAAPRTRLHDEHTV